MSSEPCTPVRRRRRCLVLVGLLFLLPVSGCGLIADEVLWLDPVPADSPDQARQDVLP